MRIFDDLDTARKTVLLRRSLAQAQELPRTLGERIQTLFGKRLTPDEAVRCLREDVARRGDQALREWTLTIDGLDLDELEVPRDKWEAALSSLSPALVGSMQKAVERVRAFHEQQVVSSWQTSALGGVLGQRVVPLQRVGVYVPGGTAPLPSSLLMAALPARVAGVDEIIVCTPASRDERGVPGIILAAAMLAEVDRVFRLGGALAIAAMAYSTESVPAVDKIVGAGGLFTTIAKRQVFGQVGLDGIYGPTETVVVADESANPAWIAADLLAQAEHDPLATAILLTPSRRLAEAVASDIAVQLDGLNRKDIAGQSLDSQGGIVITPDLETAVVVADEFAPEHLCLSVADPWAWVGLIRHAGGLFLGEHSCEVLGDYIAGPSHIMPTGGTARFASPVNVLDFVKVINVIALDDETAQTIAPDAVRLARAESLTAHAAAAQARS
jgi:histidinol dehydrogenase